jgi:hypothetical protein
MFVVPKGVEHKRFAPIEAKLLLLIALDIALAFC